MAATLKTEQIKHPDVGDLDTPNIAVDASQNVVFGNDVTVSGVATVSEQLVVSVGGGLQVDGCTFQTQGAAPIYGCRAWVVFNGESATADAERILQTGNVTSVSRTGAGKYTIVFSTAMPLPEYAVVGFSNLGTPVRLNGDPSDQNDLPLDNISASSVTVNAGADAFIVSVAVFC